MLTEDVKANKTALLRGAYKIEPQLSTKKLLFEIKYCLHFLLEVSRDAMRHFSPSFNFKSGFFKNPNQNIRNKFRHQKNFKIKKFKNQENFSVKPKTFIKREKSIQIVLIKN